MKRIYQSKTVNTYYEVLLHSLYRIWEHYLKRLQNRLAKVRVRIRDGSLFISPPVNHMSHIAVRYPVRAARSRSRVFSHGDSMPYFQVLSPFRIHMRTFPLSFSCRTALPTTLREDMFSTQCAFLSKPDDEQSSLEMLFPFKGFRGGAYDYLEKVLIGVKKQRVDIGETRE